MVPALVVFVGLLLRLAMLGIDVRLHPDEALFAAQARLLSQGDDLLLRTTDLDKPPLTLYTTAAIFSLLGPSEFAARLPNVFFSALSVALVYRLGFVLYGDRVAATLAAGLAALSPYGLAFAATVFTDIQATFWTLTAIYLAARGHWRRAGLVLALAIAAKTSSLAFLPLVALIGMVHDPTLGARWSATTKALLRFALAAGTGITLLVMWDLARQPRSFFALGFAHNNPGRFIRSDELWARAGQWGHWLKFVTGSPVLNVILAALVLVWLLTRLRFPLARQGLSDWIIAGFGVAFLGWHWLVAFNTYDRYLYPLIPLLFILAARAVVGLHRQYHSGSPAWLVLVPLLLMLPAVYTALTGPMPLGGDQGQHTGIDEVAAYLNEALAGETIYDHWLGWELAFYLGPDPPVTLVYMPLPEALAADMVACTCTRYFVAPASPQIAPWLDALRRNGLTPEPVFTAAGHRFVAYRITAR